MNERLKRLKEETGKLTGFSCSDSSQDERISE